MRRRMLFVLALPLMLAGVVMAARGSVVPRARTRRSHEALTSQCPYPFARR